MPNPVDQPSASGQRKADSEPTADSSEGVEWRDISRESPPTTPTATEPSASVTGRIRAQAGESLTIEAEGITVTLVGVPKVALDDLIYAHQQPSAADGETTRYCALFDIENTGDTPLHWLSRRTTFIGTDGYTYGRASVALDSAQLAPGCHTNHVQIEPRCRARVITPVEKLPDGVAVSAVVQTVAVNGGSNQRFRFTL